MLEQPEQIKSPRNRIKEVRARLGLTQIKLAELLNMTQGNIGHYENLDQVVPPDVARRVILVARSLGHELTFEDIYGEVK